MLEFQEKRKLKNFIYSKVVLVILVILICVLLNAVWSVYKKQDLTRDNLAKTAATLDSLRAREKMLSSNIERLKTETGTEEEIREKYGLVKIGEEVIVVVDRGEATSTDNEANPTGFWEKMGNWFR